MEERLKLEKRQLLRNNEYYEMQHTFDELYKMARKDNKFTNLMEYISSERNILLAYRNIKKNNGSTTVGTDNLDIKYFENMNTTGFVKRIQNKLRDYKPKSVRRVEIPKPNGKTRPLGIPCIEDRIIQQCIKQVLGPICESKFHPHSYGFRPNRGANHAIARCMKLINHTKCHYVVDIDIKGFFDNVNHSKLKKQLWNLGIQDKNTLSIIGKILKSEIEGIGVPTKGTPQGGIISPLLSNVVLNELDWWISNQWETMKTKFPYKRWWKYEALRKNSSLKEVWIVRYADDFKIFCKDHKTAQKIFVATKKWLLERLGLKISPEKSKTTNLRKNYTEYLGFKMKVTKKGNKNVCKSRMCDKAHKSTIIKMKKQIKIIQKINSSKEISRLNSIILGSHNYYRYATHVNVDFAEISFLVNKSLKNRLRRILTDKPKMSKTYKNLYGNYNAKGVTIFPIYGIKTKPPMCFSQEICNYTEEGRKAVHTKLKKYKWIIAHLLNNVDKNQTTEYSDNRISLMIGQQGKCYITGKPLEAYNMECHHKKPKSLGGNDEYKNLVWLKTEAHKLIHAVKTEVIRKYMNILNLDTKGLKRVNSLRKLVGNSVI
ncbi:group II intron reverse transcriptase/maturase [Clostridium sporogenes]|uniref:Group II intron reverse transcriptase/maturase n=1 Tax=Clostridium sporogenes TaxID=1509 RepID=A0A1L3NJF1_CLOSG|nr:group II intron reverse transcriptase/maturase [Clostridium sporogenes]